MNPEYLVSSEERDTMTYRTTGLLDITYFDVEGKEFTDTLEHTGVIDALEKFCSHTGISRRITRYVADVSGYRPGSVHWSNQVRYGWENSPECIEHLAGLNLLARQYEHETGR